MAYPVQNNRPAQDYYPVDETEGFEDSYGFGEGDEDFGFESAGDTYVGKDSPGGGSSVSELRKRIKELEGQLEASSIRSGELPEVRAQLEALKSQVNAAAHGKDKAQKISSVEQELGKIEARILGIGEGEEIPGSNWGEEEEGKPAEPMTRESLQALIKAVEKGEREPEEGAKLSKEQCLTMLNEALSDLDNGRQKAAASGYQEALQNLGGPKDPKEIVMENYGESPSKIEGDTITYQGTAESDSFSLKSADQSKTIVVEGAKTVDITPKTAVDAVNVTEEGGYYVIKSGTDTFKVKSDAKLHIHSDKVTGDIENKDGKITVGASGKTTRKYIDPQKLTELGDKIVAGINDFVLGEYVDGEDGDYGSFTLPKSKYGINDTDKGRAEACMKEAKNVLSVVADALRESDPVKRKEAMEYATEVLSRARTQEATPGYANNKAQAIFNVLIGQLGESGFAQLIEQGLISVEFSDELAKFLESNPEENNDVGGEVTYHIGGNGWSHSTSAEFLKRHSRKIGQEE